ncbi:Probable polygalacturonase [Linum perenne]
MRQTMEVTAAVCAVLALVLSGIWSVEAMKSSVELDYFEFTGKDCRANVASITDFGGIGDGNTSNTKAFQAAMDSLANYSSAGGSLLYVPPGRWLTGSFNITGSHFTLYLDQDAVLLASQSGVRIKTAVGRGGYVKDIYVRRMTMKTMKWAFWMTGNYGSHPDNNYDPKAIPVIQNINYRDMVAENVTMAARLEGIGGDPFTGICISNVTIGLTEKPKKLQWNCTDIAGVTSGVTPKPCDLLPDQGQEKASCNFPEDTLAIEDIQVHACSYSKRYF